MDDSLMRELKNVFWLQVVNALPVGVVFLSAQGEFLEVNQAYLDMISVKRDKCLRPAGKKKGQMWRPSPKRMLEEIDARGSTQGDVELTNPESGEVVFARVYGTRVHLEGQTVYIAVFFEDHLKPEVKKVIFSGLKEMQMEYSLMSASLGGMSKKLESQVQKLNRLSGCSSRIKLLLEDRDADDLGRRLWKDEQIREMLSKREYQVLMYLREGLRLKSIAEITGLDTRTIGTYKSRALKKLDIKDNSELKELLAVIGPS
ncbi:MAG: LuxR C-terminal-related transcriptional regulator [Desulfobacterales bacterium]